jgi:uncharacterized protein YodC (DUF2158 family)
MNEEIVVGKVVRVKKIEAPLMIVTFANKHQVNAFWFDDHNKYQYATFSPEQLEVVID